MLAFTPGLIKKRRYQLLEEVGRGGFSRCVKAWDRLQGKMVCIKIMSRDVSVDVANELSIASSLSGVPGCLQLLDYFKTRNHHYIVTELYAEELYTRIVSNQCLPEVDARIATKSLLEIVANLHARNIIHRDLKPEQILYRAPNSLPGDFVLIDFGLARAIGPEPDAKLSSFAGSAGYIAPECYASTGAGRPADMFSVGLIVYAMLSGGTPFRCRDASGLAYETLAGHIRFPMHEWQSVSPVAIDFVRRCLAFEPSARLTAVEALSHPWICPSRSSSARSMSSIASSVSSLGRILSHSRRSSRATSHSSVGPPMLDLDLVSHKIGDLVRAPTEIETPVEDSRPIAYMERPLPHPSDRPVID